MPSTSTSVPFSAKNLRLASARRRVRAFIDQIIELESADFGRLDGEDARKLITAESLPLRDYLERLPPTADDASVHGACAQPSLISDRHTHIRGFILRSRK